MLIFNPKKKILSIIEDHCPVEIYPKSLKKLNLKINTSIKDKKLIVTIELKNKYKVNWNVVSDDLKEKLLRLKKFNSVNVIFNYHKE